MFERQDLELERFISPGYFTGKAAVEMKEERRREFFEGIEKSRRLAQDILRQDPSNLEATYFLGSAEGIQGSFSITIDRSVRAAFDHGRKAYQLHLQVVEADPEFYDAYMSVGMYEYIVASIPWYLRWLTRLIGYRGSKERGLEYLQKAADKADFVSNDARVLQMLLFVREHRYEDALRNVVWLRGRYPANFILHLNHAQILERMGRKDRAVEVYLEVLRHAEAGRANYQKLRLAEFRIELGRRLIELGQTEAAFQVYEKVASDPDSSQEVRAQSLLRTGQLLDLMGKRDKAVKRYREVLELPNFGGSHRQAKRFLRTPFDR
ncbi:MAG TPA: tetratricopeptide repeat protein [Acidobacteriota bacterium]|nr:tetratricopeptide repeat protein [Acidobacteriota bacterium]